MLASSFSHYIKRAYTDAPIFQVRVARTLPNCQIVSVDWLVESVLENRPLNAVDYLLVAAENTSVFSENRSDTPQLPVVPRTNLQIYHERLIDLVDDRFNAKGESEVQIFPPPSNTRVTADGDHKLHRCYGCCLDG